jgi:hypothetical protein
MRVSKMIGLRLRLHPDSEVRGKLPVCLVKVFLQAALFIKEILIVLDLAFGILGSVRR